MNLNDIARESHAIAVEKGWYDTPRSFPELIALCHSELSEALEAFREGGATGQTTVNNDGKPEGIPSELADVIIRVCDMADFYGIDLDRAVEEKITYNRSRPYRHGGKTV